MAVLYITGCKEDGSDPGNVKDMVYGDGWAMRMDVAIQQALDGQKFRALGRSLVAADVEVMRSSMGRLYLKTRPDAYAANNLGEITSRRHANALARTLLAGGPNVSKTILG